MQLIQITNRPDVAHAADRAGVDFVMVDLESLGKVERQAGRNTPINAHCIADVKEVRKCLESARLLVRVNPLNAGTMEEVDAVVRAGAEFLMLPMFHSTQDVRSFLDVVDGRARVILLAETALAVLRIERVLQAAPEVVAVHVGLNDLGIDLGTSFLFEPLASGLVDVVASNVLESGRQFGFGGLGRLGEGDLPADWILGEHIRVGSSLAILSRTFAGGANRAADFDAGRFAAEVARLRDRELAWSASSAEELNLNRERVKRRIWELAGEAEIAGTPAAPRGY